MATYFQKSYTCSHCDCKRKQHQRVTISRWTGMLRSIGAQNTTRTSCCWLWGWWKLNETVRGPAQHGETCQLYSGNIYMFSGSNSKFNICHAAYRRYNSATVIHCRPEFIFTYVRLYFYVRRKLRTSCSSPIRESTDKCTASKHPKQLTGTWHPRLLAAFNTHFSTSVLVTKHWFWLLFKCKMADTGRKWNITFLNQTSLSILLFLQLL